MLRKFLCLGIFVTIYGREGEKWDNLQARPLLEAAEVAEDRPIRGQAASASRR